MYYTEITFIGGPFDGEIRVYTTPQPLLAYLNQEGSSTIFTYRLYYGAKGRIYVFERAYRPAAQDCRGK